MDIKTPLHLAYVATLPCEALMSAKQAINDKLQGVVGLLIIKLRKVYCWVFEWKKCLKSVNIWQSYKRESDYLMHFARHC